MNEKDENDPYPPYKKTESFMMNARNDVAAHSEDPRLLLLGACRDESVKWLNVPTIGRRNVVKIVKHQCPGCGNTHNAADLGMYDGKKRLYTIRCMTIEQFIVYKKQFETRV